MDGQGDGWGRGGWGRGCMNALMDGCMGYAWMGDVWMLPRSGIINCSQEPDANDGHFQVPEVILGDTSYSPAVYALSHHSLEAVFGTGGFGVIEVQQVTESACEAVLVLLCEESLLPHAGHSTLLGPLYYCGVHECGAPQYSRLSYMATALLSEQRFSFSISRRLSCLGSAVGRRSLSPGAVGSWKKAQGVRVGILYIYLLAMITLNVQLGVNPLISHHPRQLYLDPACALAFTVGDNGELVGWRGLVPVFQMCPSLSAEADRLLAVTAVLLRDIEQLKQTRKLVTLHNDNRLRVWAQDDGTCLNASTPGLFPEPIVALIAPRGECRFLVALAEEAFYIVDCWQLRVAGKVSPKKEAYARFRSGSFSEQEELQICDGNNRAYRYPMQPLLSQHFLDFGASINDASKLHRDIEAVCASLSALEVQSYYRKSQGAPQSDLGPYEQVIGRMRGESLAEVLFSAEMLRNYPSLRQLLQGEQASISTLHFIAGAQLFLFVGTQGGTLLGVPVSAREGEPLVLVREGRREGSAVRYVRVFGGSLFVSWEDGWLGVYSVQNLASHLEIFKINGALERRGGHGQVWSTNLLKMHVLQEKMSSFVKYSLPAYHSSEGTARGSCFFRLDRNEVIRFEEGTATVTHFRGICEDTKVYCAFLVEEYVGICTSLGVELYSPLQHQRRVDYADWLWEDFAFLHPPPADYEYRRSQAEGEAEAAGMLKFNSRWVFGKLDYCCEGEAIFSETLGGERTLSNEDFPAYHFLQRGEVAKALHSSSSENYALVIKMKLTRVRRDCWENAAFLLHGNLNSELEDLQGQKGTLRDILLRDFEFYMLLPWADLAVPFLSHQMKTIGKCVTLRRRQAVQGVGKSFTIHLEEGTRARLSERMLCLDGAAAVGLLQCWVLREPTITDCMVEAVEYFARLMGSVFGEAGDIVLARLAVSGSQHVSKAAINLLISRAITGHMALHPVLEYFLLSQRGAAGRTVGFNETVWLVYLGLACIFAGQRVEQEQERILVLRFVTIMQEPSYLLTVMRVFNEGVSKWRRLLEEGEAAVRLLGELFRIFFLYDGLANVPADDKKFNFVFAKTDEALRKSMKQGIVKSIIYLGKEFSQEFHAVLKAESVNQKVHSCYPASVIEILRQFIKSERPQSHLVFYVELLLQCLSPMTPQLRKHVQKNALTTLQLLCTYSCVSFNQPSQKLSVKTHNHLYIYCLRTSTKWRTINLRDERPVPNPLVEMSPKGTYIALLSDKLRVWRLSSGFWSGVLGAFSQDWVFEANGKGLRWEENEESITVINQNPNKNKAFKI